MCAQRGNPDDWSERLYRNLDSHFEGDHPYIVINYDYDGVLCASILQNFFPRARIVGAYDLRRIATLGTSTSWNDLGRALWVDCAIDSDRIFCIDQHYIESNVEHEVYEGWHRSSFNPGSHLSETRFDRKYPFSCSQLIYSVMSRHHPSSPPLPHDPRMNSTYALAHADSAWVSSYKFPVNVEHWRSDFHEAENEYFQGVHECFGLDYKGPTYWRYVKFTDNAANYLRRNPKKTTSKLRPWWAGFPSLSSFKSRIEHNGATTNIRRCRRHIGELFRWRLGPIPSVCDTHVVGETFPDVGLPENLGDFIHSNDVFSHAIPMALKLSYTIGRESTLNLLFEEDED